MICPSPIEIKHREQIEKLYSQWNDNQDLVNLYGYANDSNQTFYKFANIILRDRSFNEYSLDMIPTKNGKLDMSAYRYISEGIKQMSNVIKKGINPLEANLLMAHEVLKKHPATAKYNQRVSEIVNYERRNKSTVTDSVKKIEDNLIALSISLGAEKKSYKKALKEMDEIQITINEKLSRGEDVSNEISKLEAIANSDDTKKIIYTFVNMLDKASEKDLLNFISNAEKSRLKEVSFGGVTVPLETAKGLLSTVREARAYLNEMGKVNINGLRKMKSLANLYYSHSNLANSKSNQRMIDRINKNIDDAISRIEISMKEGKYYPHYAIQSLIRINDLMASIDDKSIYDPTGSKTMEMMRTIENAITSLSANQMARSNEESHIFNMNPTKVLESYGQIATQFNKNMSLMEAYMEMLSDLRGKTNTLTSMEGIDSIIEFTTEKLRATMFGSKDVSNPIAQSLKTLTKISSISKMGFSPTGALRNSTQIFFYIIAAGLKNYRKGNQLISSDAKYQAGNESLSMRDIIASQEEEGGYFFDAIENVTQGSLFDFNGVDKNSFVVKEDANGEFYLEYKRNGITEILDEATAKVLNASLFLHQKAENYIRKKVYENAFALYFDKMYNSDYYKKLITGYFSNTEFDSNGNPKWIEKITPQEAINKLKKEANAVALKWVEMTQFEYGKHQKPKIFGGGTDTKSAIGSALFQFMTYASGMFSYNKKIFTEAYKAVSNGDFDNWSVGAAARLAGMQIMIGILSILFNNDFSYIISNDTYERLSKLHKFLTSDEKEKVNFGQGLLSLTTGPIVSDALFLANAAGMDWSDSDIAQLILGYNNYADMTESQRNRRLMQTASVAAARLMKDAEYIKNGNMAEIIRNYMMLYPTKETREGHKELMSNLGIKTSYDEKNDRKYYRKELEALKKLKTMSEVDKQKYIEINRRIRKIMEKQKKIDIDIPVYNQTRL